jgi:hypothetical protein
LRPSVARAPPRPLNGITLGIKESMKNLDQNAVGRAKYKQMWDITADVIRKWDPYQLLAGGAPRDEWDSEISSVVAPIPRIHSASDAAAAVSRVFASSLDPSAFTADTCSDVGAELFTRLQERGFVT